LLVLPVSHEFEVKEYIIVWLISSNGQIPITIGI